MDKCSRKFVLGIFLILIAVQLSNCKIFSTLDLSKNFGSTDEFSYDDYQQKSLEKPIKHPEIHEHKKNQNLKNEKFDWISLNITSSEAVNDFSIINILEGENFVLDCNIRSHPIAEAFWIEEKLGGNIPYEELGNSNSEYNPSGEETSFVSMKLRRVIDCATKEHSRFYTCFAKAGNAAAASTVFVNVLPNYRGKKNCYRTEDPLITKYFESALVPQGEVVALPCSTKIQSEDVKINWEIPGVVNDRISQERDGTLVIKPITFDEMGNYKCTATFGDYTEHINVFVYPYKKKNSDSL